MEVSMLDSRLADKAVHLEFSLGNAGNVLDGYNIPLAHRCVHLVRVHVNECVCWGRGGIRALVS